MIFRKDTDLLSTSGEFDGRLNMLNVLHQAEHELPELLQDIEAWQGLLIDYHPPTVERVYRQWGHYRIFLHLIESCAQGEALFHPHPWPSAMKILTGKYEMEIGFGPGNTPPAPETRVRVILGSGSEYEMIHPDQWHAVRPVHDQCTTTLMVAGKPWDRESPKSTKPLKPLSRDRFIGILDNFKKLHYRKS